jgi:hypothetical protein
MTQCEAILSHLEAGNTITPAEAYALCGSLALHSRIAELRGRGYPIDCEIVKTPSGKHVGRYTLNVNEAIAYG